MELEKLKDKKILILGFGEEGKDTYLALKKLFPEKIANRTIAIADQLSEAKPQIICRTTKMYCGEDYLKAVAKYNLIIKTPGISLSQVKPFLKKGTKTTSQTEIFFDNFRGIIIGVTGTKGKGTTSSLIYAILKKAGIKAHLIGNIGKPVFQLLLKMLNEIVVYELSSHQLQNLKKSPQIAVFLNLFPDHLDYYKNLQEYQKAKENITKWQGVGDYLIYNANDKRVRQIAKKSKAQKVPISLKKPLTIFERSLKNHYQLKGEFNLLNLKTALAVAKIFNVSKKTIKKAVKNFKGLPHRLEYIGKYKGIEFYNDSMSTLPEVTIAALSALGDKVKSLIIGGSEKGSDYKVLARAVLKNKVRNLIIFSPSTGDKVWQEINERTKERKNERTDLRGLPQPFFIGLKNGKRAMAQAARIAFAQTKKGEVCLLSPGAASFNLFQDYQERGNLFKRYVRQYAKKNFRKR